MSTEIIVAIVGLGLFVLVIIAITMQSIEKNQKEKKRQQALLNARARNFDYMLNGFPSGFLSRDLQVLVAKSLQEVYRQLRHLLPKDKSYAAKVNQLDTQLAALNQSDSVSSTVTLTDRGQITEVQKLLKGLYNFIGQLTSGNRITADQARAYTAQVKALMLQTTIDALNGAIAEALKAGKIPLALHNLKMVIEKLEKENHSGQYTTAIANYKLKAEELGQQGKTQTKATEKRREEHDAEWDDIAKESDDTWKKKAVYD